MKKSQIKKNRIKAVLFDVGGVLALGESSERKRGKFIPSGVHLNMAKKLNISIDQYLDSIDTAYVSAITGKLSKKEVIETLSKNFRIPSKKLKKLNLSPKEILFIDNQKWNILPAKKLGMSVILFKSNKQLFYDEKWRNLWK